MGERQPHNVEQTQEVVKSSEKTPEKTPVDISGQDAQVQVQYNLDNISREANKEAESIRSMSDLLGEDVLTFFDKLADFTLRQGAIAALVGYEIGANRNTLASIVKTEIGKVSAEFKNKFKVKNNELNSVDSNVIHKSTYAGLRVNFNEDLAAILSADFDKKSNVKLSGGMHLFDIKVGKGDGNFDISYSGNVKVHSEEGLKSIGADLGFKYYGPDTFNAKFSIGSVFEYPEVVNEKFAIKLGLQKKFESGESFALGVYFTEGKHKKSKETERTGGVDIVYTF